MNKLSFRGREADAKKLSNCFQLDDESFNGQKYLKV